MALIVLIVVFRTFVAVTIPILLALTALAIAFVLLFILAGLTDINTITPLLVSMIGLGVGIDYSLFIVTRFRQLLHEGLSPVDAAAEAGASAGRAVLFAGLTVAISVTGLAFFGLDFVTKLGIGSALGVLTTVAIANSLLISVLAKLGKSRGAGIEILLFVITLGFYGVGLGIQDAEEDQGPDGRRRRRPPRPRPLGPAQPRQCLPHPGRGPPDAPAGWEGLAGVGRGPASGSSRSAS